MRKTRFSLVKVMLVSLLSLFLIPVISEKPAEAKRCRWEKVCKIKYRMHCRNERVRRCRIKHGREKCRWEIRRVCKQRPERVCKMKKICRY